MNFFLKKYNPLRMLNLTEFLTEIYCINESCKTLAYWIGSVIGQIIIIGIVPAICYVLYRRYKKKKSKEQQNNKKVKHE